MRDVKNGTLATRSSILGLALAPRAGYTLTTHTSGGYITHNTLLLTHLFSLFHIIKVGGSFLDHLRGGNDRLGSIS